MNQEKTAKKVMLLIGPLPDEAAGKVGGARVSFSLLIRLFREELDVLEVINTQTYNSGWRKALNPFSVVFQFFKKIGKCELVFINVSQKGTRYLVPLLYFLARSLGKTIVFRPFGGSLAREYKSYSTLQKYFFERSVQQVDLLLLQTKELIRSFQESAKAVYWFPTSREDPGSYVAEKEYRKKLVYIGHVKPSKGIDTLLEAYQALSDSYTLHIYGPVMDQKYRQQPAFKAVYQGVLHRDEVQARLRNYDLLIFPSFFEGEGYPGAIIEAYSMGLPVIATQWKAIPEIVIHGQTGCLIPIRSAKHLREAILHFNPENHADYRHNCRVYFLQNFEARTVHQQLLTKIETL